jgi:hypothetical protein
VLDFYSTIVRAPEFQSVSLLPAAIKQTIGQRMQHWMSNNEQFLTKTEQTFANKTIGYLIDNPIPQHTFDQRVLEIDFIKFLQYYNNSSKLKYQQVYPTEFLNWIQLISNYETMHHTNT